MKTVKSNSVVPGSVLKDCQSLTPSKLREKYEPTYTSWRDMKARRKTEGAEVAPQFDTFASFLAHVGPRPSKGYTLDRLNNDDPEYAPGKVAWRSVKAQNSNKGDTVFFTDSEGTTLPLMAWAKKLGISPNTLYSRRKLGWSDIEILHGKIPVPPESREAMLAKLPWPEGEGVEFEKMFQKQFTTEKNPILDRREFLIHALGAQIRDIGGRIYDLHDDLPPYKEVWSERNEADAAEIKALSDQFDAKVALRRKLNSELVRERKREEFAHRAGGLGTSIERHLFDLFGDVQEMKYI